MDVASGFSTLRAAGWGYIDMEQPFDVSSVGDGLAGERIWRRGLPRVFVRLFRKRSLFYRVSTSPFLS